MSNSSQIYNPGYLSENAVHSPRFNGLKVEGFRIGIIVIFFILALICIRYGLSLSSPIAKALTIVFIALFIALFTVFSLHMGWI